MKFRVRICLDDKKEMSIGLKYVFCTRLPQRQFLEITLGIISELFV